MFEQINLGEADGYLYVFRVNETFIWGLRRGSGHGWSLRFRDAPVRFGQGMHRI